MDNVRWFLFAMVAFVVILTLVTPGRRTSRRRYSRVSSSRVSYVNVSAYSPYEKQPYLLTGAERSFYEVLHRAVAPNLVVFPKVRLADVVKVRKGTESWQSHHNRINAKQIDFLVCTCDTLSPALVIELDDSSHERADRQERDAFVDSALASAGLPILHVPARSHYNPVEIAAKVQATLLAR